MERQYLGVLAKD